MTEIVSDKLFMNSYLSLKDMFNKPPFCYLAHSYVCPCLFGGFGGTPLSREEMEKLLKGYMDEMYKLIKSGRYVTCCLCKIPISV